MNSSPPDLIPIGQLDFFRSNRTVPFVSRLAKLVSLLLVAVWLPATLHCSLEALGLNALFACPAQPLDAEHGPGKDACADDGCQTVETGQIAFSKSRITPAIVPSPDAVLFAYCLLQVAPSPPALELSASRQTELLPMQRTWQFTRRAALPARAPDALTT